MINLKKGSFLIVGLARNCEKLLPQSIRKLENAFLNAKKVEFLIIESDSSDNSVKVLYQLSIINKNFKYISLGNLRKQYSKRTERIAYCRNFYLKIIKESSEYRDIDYIVVADMDGVNSKINNTSIRSCWDRKNWDVCTANQLGPYYDIWALRHHIWSPNDCWKQSSFLLSMGLSNFQSVFASVLSRMIRISPESEWIEVDSAFGGLAIYRKEVLLFQSVFYIGLTEEGEEVCEHVYLHKKIREEGGKIFICPAMINAGLVEHARYATSFGLFNFWVRCQLRNLMYGMKLMPYLKKALIFMKASST